LDGKQTFLARYLAEASLFRYLLSSTDIGNWKLFLLSDVVGEEQVMYSMLGDNVGDLLLNESGGDNGSSEVVL